jgi:hypothetical protein
MKYEDLRKMASNLIRRNYKMSDAELIGLASKISVTLKNCLEDLESYGITSATISEFDEMRENFLDFRTDSELKSDMMIANSEKIVLRNQLLEVIRGMAMRVKIKWGANSSNYKRLELRNPTLMKNDVLLVISRSIHSKMTEYLPELGSVGLTQQMLNDFESLNTQFEQSLDAKSDAVVLRDEKTLERIAKGNELYAEIIKYCNIGKTVFAQTDYSRYKHFVIYRSARKKKKDEEGQDVLHN